MSENQIVLFGADYEFRDWKKAFKKYDWSVVQCGLEKLYDVAIKYEDTQTSLCVTLSRDVSWNPIGGIWRSGAIKPRWQFEPFLEILKGAGESFCMINSPDAHLICAQRIRMLSALKQDSSLPIVPFEAFVSGRHLIENKYEPDFPVVVKIGNFQQGLMKWKINDEDQWYDVFGAFRALEMPVIIEKYVEFETDYRALFIGEEVFLMQREFEGWKANRATGVKIVPTNEEIEELTAKAKETIGLDVGAFDFVEGKDGYTIFEIGDCPTLDPDFLGIEDTWEKVADLLYQKVHR